MAAIDAVAPLCRIVDATTRLLVLPHAYIVARKPEVTVPIVTSGVGLWNSEIPNPNPKISRRLSKSTVVSDLTRDRDFADYAITREPLAARFLASVPLPLQGLSFPVTLTSIGHQPIADADWMLDILEANATFAADLISSLLQNLNLVDRCERQMESKVTDLVAKSVEPSSVTADFLLRTLVRQRRIRERKGETFLATATWRSSIREEQLSALKVLKAHLPSGFVDSVAADLAASLRAVTGGQSFKYVTWVPCGHSGPGCLAEKSAIALSRLVGAEPVKAFAPLPVSGSSHPRKSARLPTMRLLREFDAPVVLIDDVATTGTHMHAAVALLRQAAPAVFPIAWIAR